MPWPGLIVHKKCTVTVLQGGVGVQDGVVGLHDSCRDLKVVNFKKGCNHRKGFYCTSVFGRNPDRLNITKTKHCRGTSILYFFSA